MFGKRKATGPLSTSLTPARPPINLVKDRSGESAVDLTKVRRDGHINLVKSADAVGVELRKQRLDGIRAQVVVLLDHSGSMYGEYEKGKVQQLVERALGFSLQVDIDGTIEVIRFDDKVWKPVKVNVGNYQGVVRDKLWAPNNMGSTNMAGGLQAVQAIAAKSTDPIMCIVMGDGQPDSESATTAAICELSRFPVFLKLLALKSVPYFQELDDLEDTNPGARLLDNVDTQPGPGGPNLLSCSDEEFAKAMTEEWYSWFEAATAARILTAA